MFRFLPLTGRSPAWRATRPRTGLQFVGLLVVGLLGFAPTAIVAQPGGSVQPLLPLADSGISAVVRTEAAEVVHTAQLYAWNAQGHVTGSAGEQVDRLFAHLDRVLQAADSGFAGLIRLNVYAAEDAAVLAVRTKLQAGLTGGTRPAVTFCVGRLAEPGALVALDAVAGRLIHVPGRPRPSVAALQAVSHVTVPGLPGGPRTAHATTLPLGKTVYISGQAEAGADVAESTRKTLASLHATLKHLGLDKRHVVQVKSFVRYPDAATGSLARPAELEVARFFAEQTIPAASDFEWIPNSPPVESELVAWAPANVPAGLPTGTLGIVTPPGMTTPTIYSRVTVIDNRRTLYLSGISAAKDADPPGEVRQVLEELQRRLAATGSDLRHLAKATYYVSSDGASSQLNVLRPQFYDPLRPPAASKAAVRGTGVPQRGLGLDMIAIPRSE